MNSWKVILATLVIYSAGIITGALVVKNTQRIPPEPRRPLLPAVPGPDVLHEAFLQRMKERLHLAPDQVRRLEAVFRESRERMGALWSVIRPEMEAEIKEVRDRIRVELTPDQRAQFEELLRQARRQMPGRPPGELRPREPREAPPRNPLGRPGEPAPRAGERPPRPALPDRAAPPPPGGPPPPTP